MRPSKNGRFDFCPVFGSVNSFVPSARPAKLATVFGTSLSNRRTLKLPSVVVKSACASPHHSHNGFRDAMIPFSILDLSPIVEGGDAGQALRNTIDLAGHAEAMGISPLLARRAPQHSVGRQRGNGSRDRRGRRSHVEDSGGRRRHHASEPSAARHRGAVRHARRAFSRPHRPCARPRSGIRSDDGPRPATQPGCRRYVSGGCARAHRLLQESCRASG